MRQVCDGQTLASTGCWPSEDKRYPKMFTVDGCCEKIMTFARRVGNPALLTSLAMGKVKECPFTDDEVANLKESGRWDAFVRRAVDERPRRSQRRAC